MRHCELLFRKRKKNLQWTKFILRRSFGKEYKMDTCSFQNISVDESLLLGRFWALYVNATLFLDIMFL